MSSIEVKGLYGQALTAFPEDLQESGCHVCFRENSRAFIKLQDIRFAPDQSPPSNISVDLDFECFINPSEAASLNLYEETPINMSNDSITFPAWWKCRIVAFDMNSCSVKLLPNKPSADSSQETMVIYEQLSKSQQIVDRKNIRCLSNLEYGIYLQDFKETTIKVPGYVATIGRYPCAYRTFVKHFDKPVFFRIIVGEKVANSNYSPISVKFYCTSTQVLSQIELTIENNWQSLAMKMNILSKKSRFLHPVTVPKLETEGVTETFEVLRSVVKFCIGYKGSNINDARKIPGVINVFVNDPTIIEFFENAEKPTLVTIHAETKEAALQARAKLEYIKLLFAFPYQFTGRLIGKQTKNISNIIDKTKVVAIFHDEDIENSNEEVNSSIFSNVTDNGVAFEEKKLPNEKYGAFIITGTRETVQNAKIMLQIQVESICSINKLEQFQLINGMKPREDKYDHTEHRHNVRHENHAERRENREDKRDYNDRRDKQDNRRDNHNSVDNRELKSKRNIADNNHHMTERKEFDKRPNIRKQDNHNDVSDITKGLRNLKTKDERGSGDAPNNVNRNRMNNDKSSR